MGTNTATTATSATYAAQSLVFTGSFGVAVPENAATRTATHCYPATTEGRRKATMAINPTLRELKKALGSDYRIYNIVWNVACTAITATASTSRSAM